MEGGSIPLEIGPVHEVELQRFLGGGGFGLMWKVADRASGRLYALKVIRNVRPGSISEARVRNEVGVAIHSEFVVPAIGLQEWNPTTFLILFEYFDARPLDDLLLEGALGSADKHRILLEVLQGVSDAHRHNVVHRDLKPANVLVCRDGRSRLIDFGISKFKDVNVTGTGDLIGTYPYMAPETFLRGSKYADARSDIYSLGHFFYELAMGQHFWIRRGWRELSDLVHYLSAVPAPTEGIDLSDFSCDFYPGTAAIVRRMVKIAPEERYESVDDILVELGHIPELPPALPDLGLRSPVLIVESGSNRGARTVLGLAGGGCRVMGRFDIAGEDNTISRKHLEFSRQGETYLVRDLASRNGTWLRGVRLEPDGPPAPLRHGDRIKVGDVFLRFAFMRDV